MGIGLGKFSNTSPGLRPSLTATTLSEAATRAGIITIGVVEIRTTALCFLCNCTMLDVVILVNVNG